MLNQGWIYWDRVKLSDVGLSVLDFYAQKYVHSTRKEWGDRLINSQIFLDGKPTQASQILAKNQTLAYHREPWDEPDAPLNYEVLHQEDDFLIINKPSGLPVLPSGFFLENTLLHQLRKNFPNETPVPIHRLGRGTSGLMILGRSPLGRKNLTQQLREHQITKIYRALIPAGDYPDHVTIKQAIGKIPHPTIDGVFGATPDGKFSHSVMQVLQRSEKISLVQVQIFTGRPHQIRIHLAAIGYPLIGDRLYIAGGLPNIPEDPKQTALPGDCGYHLHAHHLKFNHPETQEKLEFTSVLPNIFKAESLLCVNDLKQSSLL